MVGLPLRKFPWPKFWEPIVVPNRTPLVILEDPTYMVLPLHMMQSFFFLRPPSVWGFPTPGTQDFHRSLSKGDTLSFSCPILKPTQGIWATPKKRGNNLLCQILRKEVYDIKGNQERSGNSSSLCGDVETHNNCSLFTLDGTQVSGDTSGNVPIVVVRFPTSSDPTSDVNGPQLNNGRGRGNSQRQRTRLYSWHKS